MATVVNKTTFRVILSANTPEYDPSEWLINPEIPSIYDEEGNFVEYEPKRYWKISGQNIVLKSSSERAQADAEFLDQTKENKKNDFKADQGQELLYAAQDNVDSATSVEEVNAMELNLDAWLAADPQVVIRTAKGIE